MLDDPRYNEAVRELAAAKELLDRCATLLYAIAAYQKGLHVPNDALSGMAPWVQRRREKQLMEGVDYGA